MWLWVASTKYLSNASIVLLSCLHRYYFVCDSVGNVTQRNSQGRRRLRWRRTPKLLQAYSPPHWLLDRRSPASPHCSVVPFRSGFKRRPATLGQIRPTSARSGPMFARIARSTKAMRTCACAVTAHVQPFSAQSRGLRPGTFASARHSATSRPPSGATAHPASAVRPRFVGMGPDLARSVTFGRSRLVDSWTSL